MGNNTNTNVMRDDGKKKALRREKKSWKNSLLKYKGEKKEKKEKKASRLHERDKRLFKIFASFLLFFGRKHT